VRARKIVACIAVALPRLWCRLVLELACDDLGHGTVAVVFVAQVFQFLCQIHEGIQTNDYI